MEDLENNNVDINTATVEDLVNRLNGVGQSKAKAIIRFRTTYGKFKKLCQLTEVPGITQFILDRNEGILSCDENEFAAKQEMTKIDLDQININFCAEVSGSNSEFKTNLPNDQPPYQENHNFETPVSTSDNLTPTSERLPFSDLSATKDTPIMNFTRNRLRNRNQDERNIGVSTRSAAIGDGISTCKKRNAKSDDSKSTGFSSLLPSPKSLARTPKHKNNSSKLKKSNILSALANADDKIAEPINSNRTNNVSKPGSENDIGIDENKCPDEKSTPTGKSGSKLLTSVKLRQLFSSKHRRPNARRKQQMKRKLDQRSDSTSKCPEKKQCKASSWVPSPNAQSSTFGEIKAEVTHSVRSLSRDDNISPTFSPGSPRSPVRALVPISSPGRLSDVSISTTTSAKFSGLEEWLEKFQSWSPSQRVSALDELIDICEPRQVRHMLEVIEPQFQRDFISLLPKELALYVLSFLDPKSLLTAAQTCKYWHVLAEDNLLWREKCAEEGIKEPYYPRALKGSWRSQKHSSVIASCLRPSEWKASFIRQHNIEMNWRNGNQKSLKMLKGHDDHVITCLQFNGNRIVSGSDDNTLKVWSAVSGKCLRTLAGHTGGVWASQMVDNLIISGSTDRTLKIWNADSGECIHTLYGHTSTVRCMALHGKTCVSGSRDATLRIWDIDSGACVHVLMGHLAAVRCVCYDGKRVVSGAYDYNVKVWDPETKACIYTLDGHQNRVYSLQFDGVHVVSGSLDTSIKVWSVDTGKCLHTLVGHQSLTSGMELKDNILVSGNADSTVKIWDILTGECLKTLEGSNKHQSAVTCLQFSGKFVITSSDDGTVKLWDAKTGKVIRDLVALDSRGSGGVVWRIRASETKLICAVGSRNGTEETKLLALDFDPDSE